MTSLLNKRIDDIPADSIYIGRGSKKSFYGNPYVIGRDGSREQVCAKYSKWLWWQIKRGSITLEELSELHGKTLVCYCSPLPCHGETLIKAAAWAYHKLENSNDLQEGVPKRY